MKSIATLAFLSFLIISCKSPDKQSKLFNTDNLPSKQYTINVDKDTTLETENGALLKIPKGALKPANGNTVTLEVKEAYSLLQMVKAGLVTQSNGEPLSSGGMIYINAVGGEKVTFTQPIKVAIPAEYLQKGMQLYKGDSANGIINWINATPLRDNKLLTAIDTGKMLFQNLCASCHAIDRDLTGPALAHFPKRFGKYLGAEGLPDDWYHGNFTPIDGHLTNESRELALVTDSVWKKKGGAGLFNFADPDYSDLGSYVCNLRTLFGGVIGTPFPDLKSEDRNAIFKYIQNESDRRNLPSPGHAYLKDCVDSCKMYRERTQGLLQQKVLAELKRDNSIKDNGPLVRVTPDTTWRRVNNAILPADFDKKVSPNQYDAVYYQFSVESFGWFNVDMMINNVDGVEESELFAKIIGDYKENVKAFLIIPSVKTYAEGGPADRNPEEFAFYHKDGKIPLPQNTDAYVLAMTETESSIAWGLKKFTTSRQQEIEVALHASSKEEFMEAMRAFDVARLHIKVADTKNATEIRRTDTIVRQINAQLKEAEKLKPKNCDCDCGTLDKPAASEISVPDIIQQYDQALTNPIKKAN